MIQPRQDVELGDDADLHVQPEALLEGEDLHGGARDTAEGAGQPPGGWGAETKGANGLPG